MPYFLMFIGIFFFGYGVWMLKSQKVESEPTITVPSEPRPTTVQITTPETLVPHAKPAEPSSQEKGLAFEKFVVSNFNKEYFALKQWQSDKFHNGRYAEANQHPDLLLEFHLKDQKHPFAVECKWKAHLPEEHIWAEERQIENYQRFAEETKLPVFVVLGYGGKPSGPESVYVLPLSKLKFSKVKRAYMENFRRQNPGTNFYFDPEKSTLR